MTGPDEYSAIADNNVYTNLMAQQNLRAAADAAERHPDEAVALGVGDDEEIAAGGRRPRPCSSPTTRSCGVHPQAEDFTDHELWDFEGTRPDQYPLLLPLPLLRPVPQAGGQAGRPGAGHAPAGRRLHAEQKARNFAYYERLTVRDSSLSAAARR